jgi:hypothetical protein
MSAAGWNMTVSAAHLARHREIDVAYAERNVMAMLEVGPASLEDLREESAHSRYVLASACARLVTAGRICRRMDGTWGLAS